MSKELPNQQIGNLGIICWGGTGHARVINELLSQFGRSITLIVDQRLLPSPCDGVPIVQGESALLAFLADKNPGNFAAVVAVGGSKGNERVSLLEKMKDLKIQILTLIHPQSYVAKGVPIGEGTQILAQANVIVGSKIGRGVILNTASSVDHDCVLGDGVHLAPGARLCGEVVIGDHSFIGAGAVILPRIKIGKCVTVGAGSIVIRDVADHVTVVGNPARTLIKS